MKVGITYVLSKCVLFSRNYIIDFSLYYRYNIHDKNIVSSLVVNIMTDSVMTALPGKSGIRLKREI